VANNQKGVTKARQTGQAVATTKKFNAGSNKQGTTPVENVRKLETTSSIEDDGEKLSLKTISREQARAIQQARAAKGLTQRDLATRINVKASVVNDYESGKAMPNVQLLAKMERVLQVKLRGKDIGTPLEPRGGKK